MLWAVFAGLSATIEVFKDGVAKHTSNKHSSVVLAWSFFLIAIPLFAVPYMLFPPETIHSQFWWALAARTLLDGTALILFFQAIRSSDISVTIPMISFTPVFLLLTSPLIGEIIPPLGMLGVSLVVLGAYVTHSMRAGGVLEPLKAMISEKGPRLMLIVALLWTGSSTFHRIGIDASNAFAWNFFGSLALILALLPLVILKRNRLRGTLRSGWWLLAGGAAYALGDTFLMLAITHGTVAYSIAIKRLSILGSVLMGGWLFKEVGLGRRLTGASVMVLGAIVILIA